MKPAVRRPSKLSVLLLLLAPAGAVSCAGCGSDPPPLVPAAQARPAQVVLALPVAAGTREVTVELALTEAERNLGLMHRTKLAADAGMLFVFPDVASRRFWMKNTLIPLDILFLDEDGTIQNIAHGQPMVEAPGYHSLRPARMVLELNQGWCAEHGLQPGMKVPVTPEVLALGKA
jgi:uncharacterized membrane protein (UPF0127 family)